MSEQQVTVRVKDANRNYWEARCAPGDELPGGYTAWEIELWRDGIRYDTLSHDMQTGLTMLPSDVSRAILVHYGSLAVDFAGSSAISSYP